MKMMRCIWSVALILMSVCAFSNFNDEVSQYRSVESSTLNHQKSSVDQFKGLSSVAVQKKRAMIHKFLNRIQPSSNLNRNDQNSNDALLFISFSMPNALILNLSDQAHQYHIPIVIRGLVDNDVKKTLQKILALKTMAKKTHQLFTGVSVDPVWFSQFDITAVPAFVVTHRPEECEPQKRCTHQPFDVIYGNQSIQDSLIEISKDGSKEIKPIAKKFLSAGVSHV